MGKGNVSDDYTDRGPYHPIAFDELTERFMAEIRENHKRLEQLEKVISPLLARTHCECTDAEARALLDKATHEAEQIIKDDFGGMESMTENFQVWLDRLRERIGGIMEWL